MDNESLQFVRNNPIFPFYEERKKRFFFLIMELKFSLIDYFILEGGGLILIIAALKQVPCSFKKVP